MAYASRSGRARTSARNPAAFAVCDRCSLWYNLKDLRWQLDWRGPILQNLRILVCPPCYDKPQENLRTIVLPADPVPVMNARVQDFAGAETDYRVTSGQTYTDPITGIPVPGTVYRVTENGCPRTTQPYGAPNGLDQNAVMPFNGTLKLGVALPVLSVSSNGTTMITVTCSAVHNLTNNSQIAVNGLTNDSATGFFSVTVTTATAFTYDIYYPIALAQEPILTASGLEILIPGVGPIFTAQPISPGSLLTFSTLITTCLIGLPYGYDQIPQIDPGPQYTPPPPPTSTAPILTEAGGNLLSEAGNNLLATQP